MTNTVPDSSDDLMNTATDAIKRRRLAQEQIRVLSAEVERATEDLESAVATLSRGQLDDETLALFHTEAWGQGGIQAALRKAIPGVVKVHRVGGNSFDAVSPTFTQRDVKRTPVDVAESIVIAKQRFGAAGTRMMVTLVSGLSVEDDRRLYISSTDTVETVTAILNAVLPNAETVQ